MRHFLSTAVFSMPLKRTRKPVLQVYRQVHVHQLKGIVTHTHLSLATRRQSARDAPGNLVLKLVTVKFTFNDCHRRKCAGDVANDSRHFFIDCHSQKCTRFCFCLCSKRTTTDEPFIRKKINQNRPLTRSSAEQTTFPATFSALALIFPASSLNTSRMRSECRLLSPATFGSTSKYGE